jgi:hypothetical protein
MSGVESERVERDIAQQLKIRWMLDETDMARWMQDCSYSSHSMVRRGEIEQHM